MEIVVSHFLPGSSTTLKGDCQLITPSNGCDNREMVYTPLRLAKASQEKIAMKVLASINKVFRLRVSIDFVERIGRSRMQSGIIKYYN